MVHLNSVTAPTDLLVLKSEGIGPIIERTNTPSNFQEVNAYALREIK